MSKPKKHVVQPPTPAGSQHIDAVASDGKPSEEYDHPVFSLIYLDKGDYCLTKCDKADKAVFADTLRKLSQMTWSSINTTNRHKLGSELLEQKAIHAPIPACVKPKDKLLALRFSGIKPMVGRREGDTFHVFWLDHDFSLYDHGS